MASKRKFKRDYIILEAKDTNFRYKERILPKAFAKVEISEEKSIVSLYVENLKSVKDGYKVVAIQSDYETLDLGRVVVSDQGKGEFVLDLGKDDIEVKGIALLYERTVPLVGFKGSKIDNYEEILFTNDSYEDDEYEEYEEIEYIEVEDGEDFDEYEEYEEIEYIEIEEDEPENYEDDADEYIEIEEDEEEEEEEEEEEYLEIMNEKYSKNYQEYDNVEETIARNMNKQKESHTKVKSSSQRLSKAKSMKYESYEEADRASSPKSAGSLLMPRQIKKGLKYFNEVKPFMSNDIEDTRWWKIEITPTTLCGYTMPYLGYVNSLNYTMYSDIVMNSYKYRHYLFGVQYDEYNKRKNYIYAIPGNREDQPDRGHTGFTTYQASDTRDDRLGYWICFIDSRTRRIIK